MALTFQQIMACVGFAELELIRIKNQVDHANDPTMDATTIAAAKADAAAALDKLQILLNTVYQALGRVQPNTTFTATQLQQSGVW